MPRPVAAAAILDSLQHPTRLLACSRAYPADLRGLFELPGGKIEEGEDPADALIREIDEELGVRITLGPCLEGPQGQWWPVLGGRLMGVWFAALTQDSPQPRAGTSHEEIRWVPLSEALALPWISADLPIVRALLAHDLATQAPIVSE